MTLQLFYMSTTDKTQHIDKETVQNTVSSLGESPSMDRIFNMLNMPGVDKLSELHVLGNKFTSRAYRKHIKNCVNKTIEKIYVCINGLLNYGFKHVNLFDNIIAVTSEIRRTKYMVFDEIVLNKKNCDKVDLLCQDIINKMNFISDGKIADELYNLIQHLLYLNNRHGIVRYVIDGEYCGSSVDLYNYTFQRKGAAKLTLQASYMVIIPTDDEIFAEYEEDDDEEELSDADIEMLRNT